MLRRYRIPFIVLATLVVAAFTTLVMLGKHYEPAVKTRLMQALNERLNAPVAVSGMDLTLIARFPMASLRLHDVLAMEVRSDGIAADTLLHARELHLEFSLWDLVRGDPTVERVHATEARLYPALDTNGAENYLIWKSDTTGTPSVIALEQVSFDRLDLRYRDHRSALEVLIHSRTLTLRGRLGEDVSNLTLAGDVALLHLHLAEEQLLSDRRIHVRMDLEFGGPSGAFQITKGELSAGNVPLEFTMELSAGPNGRELDLRANGLGLPLAEAGALLPDGMARRLSRYGLKGQMDLAVHYSGPIDGDGPALAIGARVTKGRMKEKQSGAVLDEIQGDLSLELTPKGVPRLLVVQGFSARSGSGRISGNWSSSGLMNATLKADLHGDIALADLLRFAQVDTLEQVSGQLRASAQIEGRLRDVGDLRASDLRALRIEGTAELRNATLKLKGVRHRVEQLDADLTLRGNDATIDHLNAVFQGSTVNLQGDLRNLVPYLLFDDQRLSIAAQATSPHMDLAALLSDDPAQAGKLTGEHAYTLTLPATIELDLQVRVEQLRFEEFHATAINGRVRLTDQVLRASPMTFNTASGAVMGSLVLDAGQAGTKGYPLSIDANFQDIDITQLFREFQDFGQDFIGHRHLSGRSQAHIKFSAALSPALQIDMDALVCTVDIAIDNGAIRNHGPLLEVADHLRKNKLVAPFVNTEELRARLADVRFARLENRINIRDGAVHIPAMDVKTTAMDIQLSGTHWFDDRIDHHLSFRLSDLFRLGKPQRDEFGPIVDDGTGMRIFLHMYGTVSDPLFANNGAMASDRRRQQFQQEKQELRSILQEDLGIFKGRTGGAAPASTSDRTSTQVQVVWDVTDSTSTDQQGTVPKRKRGLGKLLDGSGDKDTRERIIVED